MNPPTSGELSQLIMFTPTVGTLVQETIPLEACELGQKRSNNNNKCYNKQLARIARPSNVPEPMRNHEALKYTTS